MNEAEFRAHLKAHAYDEPELIERASAPFNDEHAHEFAAFALVIDGEVTVKSATGATTCRSGDHFELAAHTPHAERYGTDGARFLLARRYAD